MTHPTPAASGLALDATVRRPGTRRRAAFRRVAVFVIILLVLAGAGVGARAALGSSSERGLRTAKVATQSVDEVMQLVATVEPVSQASVAFPVAGTVSAVEVQPGDTVSTGGTLATLDDADLQDEVDAARAELDQAEYVLEAALDGEDVSGLTGSMPSGGAALGGGMATAVALPVREATATSGGGGLGGAQQAVLDAQSAVSAATSRAATALEAATAACPSTEPAAEPEGDEGTEHDNAACRDALQQAFTAQQDLTTAQTTLTDAASALTQLLAQMAEEPGGGGEPTTPPDTGGVPDDGGQGTTVPEGSMPSGSQGSVPSGAVPSDGAPEGAEAISEPTAEELIAFQKAVDAAAATLTVAQQALGQARIVSPISGTIVSVGLATGDEVEAASATATIVVVSDGGYEVTALVDVGDLPDLEVGQAAHVQPDGDRPAVEGEVVRIGVSGTSSGTSTTYPVTIGLTDQPSSLGNGSTATVEVVTDGASRAIAVPTSAVTATDGEFTVQVVDGSEATEKSVEVGAIGDTWTEITEGIDVGDTVVLADLGEALPGSATDSSSTSGEGGGGAGGGGLPGGGAFPAGGGGPPSFGGPGG